ncbi:MAG: GGDEF domain-containing protein [Aminipila sp.]
MRKITIPRRITDLISLAVLILLIGCIVIQLGDFYISRRTPEIKSFPKTVYSDTLTVVMDYDYEPYSFRDSKGDISGHDVELAYAIAEHLKVNLDLKLMPWTEARQAVENGTADVLMGVEYGTFELNNYELSIPLHEDGFVVFGKNEVKGLGELYGAKFAVLQDSFCYKSVLTAYDLDTNVEFYNNYHDAFKAVADGKSDYVISRYSVGQRIRESVGDKDIKPTGISLMSNRVCIGVKKGDLELKQKIDEAILSLLKDGSLDKLDRKWLGDYVNILNLKDFLLVNENVLKMSLLTIAVMVVTIFLYINRLLLKILRKQKNYITKELEHERLIADATKALYDNIYEVDITRNKAGNKKTDRYFKNLVNRESVTYDQALLSMANKDIKSEFIQGYLEKFSRQNVIQEYKRGRDNITYDLLMSPDGVLYNWIRITAQIFFWKSDKSLRMIIYRKNIDSEKRHEIILMEKVQKDPMTSLYNKTTTEELITEAISSFDGRRMDALFVIDIDDFKKANDNYGHYFGDYIIKKFAHQLRIQFRESDIVGRIGGDEFAVYVKYIPDEQWLYKKSSELVAKLNMITEIDAKRHNISASIGIAVFAETGIGFKELYQNADKALYQTKERGKNGFTIYKNISKSM